MRSAPSIALLLSLAGTSGLAFGGVLAPRAAAAAEHDPVVSMSFDRDLNDAGPFKLKGAAQGDGISLVPGRRGQALSVGGTEDWLDIELGGRPSFGQGASLVMWIQRDDWTNPYKGGSGWQTLASIGTGFSLSITAPGCPMHKPWALQGSVDRYRKDVEESESAYTLSAPGAMKARRWHHVGLVHDPASATLTMYLDGSRVDQARGVPPPDLKIERLRLGTWFKANQAYRGLIDELAVYDYPLSDGAIAEAAALR